MKWSRNAALLAALACGAALRADLAEWVQHLAAETGLQPVFFRLMPLPAGAIQGRRPPAETRAELTRRIAAEPGRAELHRLRASEAELALDFTAAEADWRQYAARAADRAEGALALADFYHRRMRPNDEIAALDAAARVASPASERFTPPGRQRAWLAFERSIALAAAEALPDTTVIGQYRAWILRYPGQPEVRRNFIHFLAAHRQFTAAEREIAAYRAAFPGDEVTPLRELADLETRRGTVSQALAVYERAFRPLLPQDLLDSYFTLLDQQGGLRDFLARARTAAQARPEDLDPAARLFHYYRHQSNPVAARRALLEYASHKKHWTSTELYAAARMFEMVSDYPEAARHYYALYSMPGSQEQGLAGLAGLLLTAPDQPVAFGSGDLSYYKDISALDRDPGFLNGILSLVLNSTSPRSEFAEQDRAAGAYFHRTRAEALVALLDARFPNAPAAPGLHARLIEAYAAYGDNAAVVRAAREFLARYTRAPRRTDVSLMMADAFGRQDRANDEFAVYDQLLRELAARAGGVPLGEGAGVAGAAPQQTRFPMMARPGPPQHPPTPARSPEYARVLERYLSRLAAMNRVPDALRVYRQELDRNPNDPGLYEGLAAFLEHNQLGGDVEAVYRRALAQFPDPSWRHKLARWYLRQQRASDFARLSREVVQIFSGSDLERYFADVVTTRELDPELYRQLNLYAHERFPNDLAFVKNLLAAYSKPASADAAAYTNLLRAYWYYDDELRSRMFENLSRAGMLKAELDAVRASSPDAQAGRWDQFARANPAAAQFLAEGEAWRSHFEAAAPPLRALAAEMPGETARNSRAASVDRSLAAFDPADTEVAAGLARNVWRAAPRDREALARIGDVYGDRGLLDRARPYWNRMILVEPGKPEAYLDAATVYWDYFQYDDALGLLGAGRAKLGNPALYAYQAGAIYEGKRQYEQALREYVQGALAAADSPEERRLLELSERPALRPLVERLTLELVSKPNPASAALYLRVAVLDRQNRLDELRAYLTELARTASSADVLAWLDEVAARRAMDDVRVLALERQAVLTRDPVERMRLRIGLAHLQESLHQTEPARRTIEALLNDNPAILGVVRAAVDFYCRTGMTEPAISTLTRSAAAAAPDYRRRFLLEAARKATDARQFDRARSLLAGLLREDPFQPAYLSAMAGSYAQAGDDAGLARFYRDTIQAAARAPLSPDERTTRVAALRRGLIPALTRLGDSAGAVDQYIELINRYPEDQGLIREAAFYAAQHGEPRRLLAYYQKASADSPRDYRWPMVLARVSTHLEDFPAAIAAYTRASAIRPDRADLFVERGALEERLTRFADAQHTYRRVYELSYRDPQWLDKVADLAARQGKADEAVAVLRQAHLEGRQESAALDFQVARALAQSGLLRQTSTFAERGVSFGAQSGGDPRLYGWIMALQRRYEAAFTRLPDWGVLDGAARAAGQAFSPEEKQQFAAFLEKLHAAPNARLDPRAWSVLAGSAGLYDLEVRWLAQPAAAGLQARNWFGLSELQTARLQFAELGQDLEGDAASGGNSNMLWQAFRAYLSGGDAAGAARVLVRLASADGRFPRNLAPRYMDDIAAVDPARVLTLAAGPAPDVVRNQAADRLLARGDARLALEAVARRGQSVSPLWTHAYTALASLYYLHSAPDAAPEFRAILGGGNIGERLAHPVDRTTQLAGDPWFYYAARYGEYLAAAGSPQAEDYLPAALEGEPASGTPYAELADFYSERGDAARAAAAYRNAVELDPQSGAVQDHLALLLDRQGRRAEALEHWRAALRDFDEQQRRPRLAESFWRDAPAAIRHIGEQRAFEPLRPQIDALLRSYASRHDAYRFEPVAAAALPYGGIDWLLATASDAQDPFGLLQQVADWAPVAERPAVIRRAIEIGRNRPPARPGEAPWRLQQVDWLEFRLAEALLDAGQPAGARDALGRLPESVRSQFGAQMAALEIRIAAREGTLAKLLDGYRARPSGAPSEDVLRDAAMKLREAGQNAPANLALEYLYTRELNAGHFDAVNFLGLAEVRLQNADAAGAVALLRRMALVAGQPFDSLLPAADLLEKYGRDADGMEFLAQRAAAVPWDDTARLRLAVARHNRDALLRLAGDPESEYRDRAAAARGLASLPGPPPQLAGELALLARPVVPPSAAEQPYYFAARVAAAASAADAAVRVRLLKAALAIQPHDTGARIALIRAAVDAGQYQLALSAAESLNTQMYYSTASWWTPRPGERRLDARERVAISEQLAAASAALGQTRAAQGHLQAALREETDPARRAALEQRRAALQHEISVAEENERRRPVISGDGLTQDHPVRPRILP